MEIYRPKLIEKKSNKELKDGIIQELRMLMVNFNSLIESENRIRKIQISKFLLDERKDSIYSEIHDLEKKRNGNLQNYLMIVLHILINQFIQQNITQSR